jgi:hypothetical protein
MKKTIIGVIVTTLVLFVWGFLFLGPGFTFNTLRIMEADR